MSNMTILFQEEESRLLKAFLDPVESASGEEPACDRIVSVPQHYGLTEQKAPERRRVARPWRGAYMS
jgi:hypothetical protein